MTDQHAHDLIQRSRMVLQVAWHVCGVAHVLYFTRQFLHIVWSFIESLCPINVINVCPDFGLKCRSGIS